MSVDGHDDQVADIKLKTHTNNLNPKIEMDYAIIGLLGLTSQVDSTWESLAAEIADSNITST